MHSHKHYIFNQANLVSDLYMEHYKDYSSIEERLGDEVESKVISILSYLDIDEIIPAGKDSIANHELKIDVWVQIGESYFGLQIKSSETGAKSHSKLKRVSFVDSKGFKHSFPAPPVVIFNEKIKGRELLSSVKRLFESEGISLDLKKRYKKALIKYKKGSRDFDAAERLFLKDMGF